MLIVEHVESLNKSNTIYLTINHLKTYMYVMHIEPKGDNENVSDDKGESKLMINHDDCLNMLLRYCRGVRAWGNL